MNGKSLAGIALVCLSLIGCASTSTYGWTSFEPYDGPNGQQMFKYRARTNPFNKEDDSAIEKERLSFLEEYLKRSNYCPNGYRIVSRKTAWNGGDIGDFKNIYYVGACN